METETEKSVVEGNRIICEFMGGEFYNDTTTLLKVTINSPTTGNVITCIDKLKYHSDWNWLMSVIDKIETFGYRVAIEKGAGTVHYSKIRNRGKVIVDEYSQSKIAVVRKAAISFIKMYNNQKQ